MKGVLPWLVRWARLARRGGTRKLYPALAALVSPVQKFFPHHTLFQYTVCVSIAQQPGQVVVQGRLPLKVSPVYSEENNILYRA